jgi:3-hydroxyacyl-CoA dehydrogenase/enoyl-CoA hydratase/3-hydroxybutyryl-CoA epimerase
MENFKFEIDADGIALASFDMPGRSMNVLTQSSIAEIAEIVERVKSDAAIKGLVITSGKPAFCAGADLDMLGGNLEAAERISREERTRLTFEQVWSLSSTYRQLETCGKPVAAAIPGTALGGGFELTLACHYRVVAEGGRTELGLPEAKVGLLPGAGGTQRLPRMIGLAAAVPLMLEGKTLDPATALGMGIIHAIVPQRELIATAKRWIKDGGSATQPWDRDDFKIPGGGPYSDEAFQNVIVGNALVAKQTFGNYEAQKSIMSCVYEGLQVPMDTGLKIEARYFTKALLGPQARNMVRTLFLSMQELGKLVHRPKDVPPSAVKKLGVLGAGMMGAGIAYVSAMAGVDVVLIDVSKEAAEKGKAHAKGILDKAVERGRQTAQKRDEVLARIHPTADFADLKGADFIVEAVFEDRKVKDETIKQAEEYLAPTTIFGSNTSTLPISSLAEFSKRPESFIGVHFFSPVDRMPLVELIKGKKTSPEAVARALDYVKAIKKTPIVVNDSRGFYTSRCFGTYVDEGIEIFAEGYLPAIVDNVGRMTGMPRGPLELADDIALDLIWRVREQTKKDLGTAYKAGPAEFVITTLVSKLERYGRKNGKGFYDYPDKGKKSLWHGLKDIVTPKILEAPPPLVSELRNRLLYRQALEAARCVEENVLTDPRDADVGAILGWGFAPWTGGPLSLIDTVGTKAFSETCSGFADRFGERFKPNALLLDMAKKGETFYGRFGAKKAA